MKQRKERFLSLPLATLLILLALSNLASHEEDFDLFVSAECEECEQVLSDISLDPSGLWIIGDEEDTILATFQGEGEVTWSKSAARESTLIKVFGPTSASGTSTEFQIQGTPINRAGTFSQVAFGDHESTSFTVFARDSEGNRTSRQAIVHVIFPEAEMSINRGRICPTANCVNPDFEFLSELRVKGASSNSSWTFREIQEIRPFAIRSSQFVRQAPLIQEYKISHTSGTTANLEIDFPDEYPDDCLRPVFDSQGREVGCKTKFRLIYGLSSETQERIDGFEIVMLY